MIKTRLILDRIPLCGITKNDIYKTILYFSNININLIAI